MMLGLSAACGVVDADRSGAITCVGRHHLLHVFPSFGIGGVPLRMASILNSLGSDMRHTIVSLDQNYAAATRLSREILIQKLDFDVRHKASPLSVFYYRDVLKRLRPDLLLTYNWGSIEWAFANASGPGYAHVHLESGFGREEAGRQMRRRVWFRRIALSHAAAVVVPSRCLLEIATDTWRLRPDRIVYIPNGVDWGRFRPGLQHDNIPLFEKRNDELIVGTLAPLRPEKNVGRLIRAFAMMAPQMKARLVILGDGSERAKLSAMAAELGLAERVVLLGHVEAPEKALALIDVFAMSSDTEQMPNSVLQAMAAARPIAAVDVGDVKSMVSVNNRPFIVSRCDEGALARSLATLGARADLRRDIGDRNREHLIRHYGEDKMVARYRDLLSSVLTA